MTVQVTEAQLFEMMGRLYTELLGLRVQVDQRDVQIRALLEEKEIKEETEKD